MRFNILLLVMAIVVAALFTNPAASPAQAQTDNETQQTMTHDLIFARQFNASVDQIWKAWSESEYVKQWWGPNGFTAPVANMDFREGGTSFVCMHSPDFGTLCNTWTYTKIVQKERIEFTHRWADENGNIVSPAEAGIQPDLPDEVPHEITIKDLDNGQTELTVSEFGYATDEMVQMSKTGLEQTLDKMAAIFEEENKEE